jgi:Ca2+-dependent lipid-binding protein
MRMQLTLHAEGLKKASAFRIGCPFAVVTITDGPRRGEELGRTEVLEDALNPDWVTVIFVDTDPGIYMPFQVTVLDKNEKTDVEKIMAEARFEMTEIYESKGSIQCQELAGGTSVYASVNQSQMGESKGTLHFHFRGLDIKNIESGVLGLGRSDPYFEIAKKNADHDAGIVRWNSMYRSEVIMDNLNPFWKADSISLETLCYNDLTWPLRISLWDWQKNGKHREFGAVETTLADLKSHLALKGNADRDEAIELTNMGATKTMGLFVILKFDIQLDE